MHGQLSSFQLSLTLLINWKVEVLFLSLEDGLSSYDLCILDQVHVLDIANS